MTTPVYNVLFAWGRCFKAARNGCTLPSQMSAPIPTWLRRLRRWHHRIGSTKRCPWSRDSASTWRPRQRKRRPRQPAAFRARSLGRPRTLCRHSTGDQLATIWPIPERNPYFPIFSQTNPWKKPIFSHIFPYFHMTKYRGVSFSHIFPNRMTNPNGHMILPRKSFMSLRLRDYLEELQFSASGRSCRWAMAKTRVLVDDYDIWVWVNTYRYIFSGMNIHLPAILGFTRYQGFDPSPYD